MSYDSKAIQDLKQQLETLMSQAALTSRFSDVISAATALEALKAWQAGGCVGDLPAAVREAKGINLPAAVEAPPAERSALAPVQQRYEEQRLAALDQALKDARGAQRRSVSVQEQRAAWEAVSKLDPSLPEAADALRSLQSAELAQGALEQLNSIQRRLSEIRYDLRQINEARWVVEGFRYDKSINEAGRVVEVKELMEQLNEMREEAQRRSDGGASSELSGDYERAFTVFRNALRDGYRVIADDRTGETIEVEPSLIRVREKYFQQQIKRTDERYYEAQGALAGGNPEVAISRLSEALTLLQPVENKDGTNWRAEVNKLLDQARREQEAKQQANQLVEDARNADEARRVYELLQRARTTYPKFPRIDILIADTQDRMVRVVLNDLHINLESAATHLHGGRYELARQGCEKVVRTGQEFSFLDANEVYRRQRTEAQELLTRIGVAEVHAEELQQMITEIQAALDARNLRLAQRLLDQIDGADLADPRVSRLSTDLALRRSDAENMAAAEKAFDNQLYEQVIELCAKLQESDGLYVQNARQLQRRARVRLLSQQAVAAHEAGRLDEAADLFKKVLDLFGALSAEDNR